MHAQRYLPLFKPCFEGTRLMSDTTQKQTNFIRRIIDQDLTEGKHSRVMTRFPPEPNGYLHIGHAKSVVLNFGIATDYQGGCNLRFDDTNPEKENILYAESIKADLEWLGYKWSNLYYASDYFPRLFDYAIDLIKQNKAYVDSLDAEQIRKFRGTLTEPGIPSPHRDRSVEENLELFQRMRDGEFPDGAHVLRAKIDMSSPNINMRDPVIYRIRHAEHWRTKDQWCIYPMYDYTHCISDALECITHSLCTLEFEDHRPLYDWILDQLDVPSHPQQIEFGRLNLDYTVMSKRLLNLLVVEGTVDGWDDPRLPTLSGLRRRGYTPAAIRDFCERIGVTKSDGVVEVGSLENCIREDLEHNAERRLAVLRPLKVIITNYPDGEEELLPAVNHPKRPELGGRQLPFSREIYIEHDDFMEHPEKKFFRLAPGREVRLRFAYFITCDEVVKDEKGEIIELRCRYDPETRGGSAPDGRKVKGTIHWVSARHAINASVCLYDRLFTVANPGADKDFHQHLNPGSMELLTECKVEPDLREAKPEERFQFERLGYFCLDSHSVNQTGNLTFNRTVSLRDSWSKGSG